MFVPYEIALKLKEKGFNETCFGFYTNEGLLYSEGWGYKKNNNVYETETLAPLYQQVFKWFRDKHNISYSIDWMLRTNEYYSGYIVHFRGLNGNKLNQENFIILNEELPPKGYGVYKIYEEAELDCINKMLELI